MNNVQFLCELELELEKQKVEDIKEILAEYEEHFAFKHEDGYSEQEIAARLETPVKIAAQYASFGADGAAGKSIHAVALIGLVLLDVILAAALILLIAWILVMGMFVVLLAALGVSLILNLNLAGMIPLMPRISACILGISCFALAVLVSIITIYFFTYSAQLVHSYIVWHRRVVRGEPTRQPGAKYLILTVRQRRGLRHTALIALAVFGIALLTSFITMVIIARFIAPWHVWEWFQ